MVTTDNGLPDFWGKLSRESPSAEVHWKAYLPLRDHSLDVALTFRQLLALPRIYDRICHTAADSLTLAQLDRLSVLALLHDFGKANLGFQNKPFDSKAPRAGHIRETAPLLREESLNRQWMVAMEGERLTSWFDSPEALTGYFFALLSHHGTPISVDDLGVGAQYYYQAKKHWWQREGDRDPFHAITELLECARKAFPAAFAAETPPLPSKVALQHRFAGLLMLADWLGSDERYFPIDNGKSERLVLAAKKAEQILHDVGLQVAHYQRDLSAREWGFEALFGFSPRPLQAALDQLSTADPEQRLLIAEAETGSGKTEAALARFLHLFEAGEVDGLYFALPTRVAARELYQRVLKTIEKAFPDPGLRPSVVLAVPGYAKVDGQTPMLLPERQRASDDEAKQRQRERCWAAEHPKRFLVATIAVGTIDQALLSALQTAHAHLRSVCLDRQLLVVDEVHASDVYMRYLLCQLLGHHLQASHALLLSATLGSVAKQAFLSTAGSSPLLPDLSQVINETYPALLNGGGESLPLNSQSERVKPITVELCVHLQEPERLLPRIADALQGGARVLVVLNTVGRAVALQKAVEQSPLIEPEWLFRCEGVICPHHGRYAPADREWLDATVSRRFGREAEMKPLLLIGTQTLEQSLDIDADLLITDLAPMDVLLQRVGRLHRHQRQRPAGYETAKVLLLVPEHNLEEALQPAGEAVGWAKSLGLGSVYADLRILQRTWDCFAEQAQIEIPRDNRLLVESTTHPAALQRLSGERWQQHGVFIAGGEIAQGVRADQVVLPKLYQQPFGSFRFSELNEHARTRLGLDALHLPLPEPQLSPFGLQLREVVIPGHLAPKDPAEVIRIVSQDDGGFIFQLANFHYRYSRFGLERVDESTH